MPIETVLAILGNLYNNGVDFVDFHGKLGETEDVLGISFSKDYMDPEYAQQFDEMASDELDELSENKPIKVKLTDNDVNDIL